MEDKLQLYYLQNYSLVCQNEIGFLEKPEVYKYSCHIGSTLMIFLASYVIFLMLKKSPPAMKSSIPFMLHLHIWTMLCDLIFAVLTCPYFYLPSLSGTPLGILMSFETPFEFQLYIAFAALGGMSSAMVTLFEQRHRAIVTESRFVMRKKSTRIIYNILFYAYYLNFGLPEILTMPKNQQEVRLDFLKKFPCPPPLFFDRHTTTIQKDGSLFNPHMYTSCITIVVIINFYFFHTLWYLSPGKNPHMSNSTRKIQRTFFISMCIQVTIPFFVIFAPTIYWNISITFQIYYQSLNNLSVIVFTLHGFSASIATITLYNPYRVYTKKLIMTKILRIKINDNDTRGVSQSHSNTAIFHRSYRI